MQVNKGDSDSDIRERGGCDASLPPAKNDAVVHELNRTRAEALKAIDAGGFSWFHLKLCFVAGTGFFTDAYDIFAISLASVMLGYVYGHTPDWALSRNVPSCGATLDGLQPLSGRVSGQQLSSYQAFGIKVAAPVGNLFGQLLFGWLADIVGRKRMYGIELMIIITSTFAQAIAGSGPAVNIIGVLIVWRFIMGVGIGGDYPLSAVISSEFASTSSRGRLMTMVFTAQGWGNFAASLVALVTLHAYKKSIEADSLNELVHLDYCWRILIGLGCVPGVIALYFRLTIPETPRFTMDIDRDIQRAKADIENVLGPNGASAAVYWVDPNVVVQRAEVPRRSRSDFIEYFARPSNLLLLFGVSYSWFAIDVSPTLFLGRRYAGANLHRHQRVAFYGLGLNLSSILTSDILTRAGIGSTLSELPTLCIYQSLNNAAMGSLVVSAAGLLPGCYASFFLIDVWGRKPIQFLGFAMSTVLLAVLADIYPDPHPDPDHRSRAVAFVAVYCLANFFTNFGPNVTTFIIPGEIFPTRYRSTAHGISAACGKLGAIVSQIIFFKAPNSDEALKVILGIFAGVTFTGLGSTWLIGETKDKSLEQLSREKQEGFIRGVTQIEVRIVTASRVRE